MQIGAVRFNAPFYPRRSLNYQGWDLKVLWRTAGKSAAIFMTSSISRWTVWVVIADVADKGMPAALFMTLVRTAFTRTFSSEIASEGA